MTRLLLIYSVLVLLLLLPHSVTARTWNILPDGNGDAPANPFCGEVAHFADVISGDATPIATPEQGVQMMQMLDAIYASSESRQGVALD